MTNKRLPQVIALALLGITALSSVAVFVEPAQAQTQEGYRRRDQDYKRVNKGSYGYSNQAGKSTKLSGKKKMRAIQNQVTQTSK